MHQRLVQGHGGKLSQTQHRQKLENVNEDFQHSLSGYFHFEVRKHAFVPILCFNENKVGTAELNLQSSLSSCLDLAFDSSEQRAGFYRFFPLSLSVDTILFITRVQFMRI